MAGHKTKLGELSIFLSCIFFTGASLLVKYASVWCSGNIISFFRFLVGGIVTLLLMVTLEGRISIHDRGAWLARGVLGGITMSATYLGIQMTSSGRAILLINTYPIFAVVFGSLFFKEKAKLNNLLGLVLCISGILLVFLDNSSYSFFGNMICLTGGVLNGLAINFIKKARIRNSPASVYLSACIFGLAFNSMAVRGMSSLPSELFGLLVVTALLSLIGQILLGYGFRYVSATKGSIIGFFETQLTFVMSWLLMGEEIRLRCLGGAGVILLGLIINQHAFARKREGENERHRISGYLPS